MMLATNNDIENNKEKKYFFRKQELVLYIC